MNLSPDLVREIVLDTETTGTNPAGGDRVVEIGAVEVINCVPTGRTFHTYINPERPMSEGAYAVHGLSDAFLADKPVFAAIAAEFAAFIGDANLVIHNAAFDIGFLDMELGRLGHPVLGMERAVDTLALARRRHPNASNSLDALCLRFGIDNTRRTKHGALLDAELLADVYIELTGGRQADLGLTMMQTTTVIAIDAGATVRRDRPIVSRLSQSERAAHLAFVAELGAASIWAKFLPREPVAGTA